MFTVWCHCPSYRLPFRYRHRWFLHSHERGLNQPGFELNTERGGGKEHYTSVKLPGIPLEHFLISRRPKSGYRESEEERTATCGPHFCDDKTDFHSMLSRARTARRQRVNVATIPTASGDDLSLLTINSIARWIKNNHNHLADHFAGSITCWTDFLARKSQLSAPRIVTAHYLALSIGSTALRCLALLLPVTNTWFNPRSTSTNRKI